MEFLDKKFGVNGQWLYICNMFFMVLDLRLTKIGRRDDNQFLFVSTANYFNKNYN